MADANTVDARAMQRVQTRPPRAHEWTEEKREIFLTTLARTLNVSASARAVGMSTVSARALRRRDAGFAEAWDEAKLAAYEDLELAMVKRATGGTSKSVWHQGKRVGREIVFSESTALQLMAQHRASVMELRGRHHGRAAPDDEGAALIARIREMQARMIEHGEDRDAGAQDAAD